MPRATVSVNDTDKFDLKTCPGGYVVLRRMPYGKMLERREIAAQMSFKAGQTRTPEGVIKASARTVALMEFQSCVVDHNLEDETGNKLDFSLEAVLLTLDPKVGAEIGDLIDKMNQYEDEPGN